MLWVVARESSSKKLTGVTYYTWIQNGDKTDCNTLTIFKHSNKSYAMVRINPAGIYLLSKLTIETAEQGMKHVES